MPNPEDQNLSPGESELPTELTGELEGLKQSGPDSDPIETEKIGKSEIKFVHAIHTKEYNREIIDALKDSDVIALEVFGMSPASRAVKRADLNVAMKPEARATLKKDLEDLDIYDQLALELLNSGKKIIFVDSSEADPEYGIEREIQDEESRDLGIMFGNSIGAVKEHLLRVMQMEARLDAAREERVREQLLEEVSLHDKPVKIAVMQGSHHTSTFHKMRRLDDGEIVASRVMVPKVRGSHVYSPVNEGHRALKHFPDKELRPELLNRGVLQRYYNFFADEDLPLPEAVNMLRAKSDEQVADILERIGKVLHSKKRILPRLKVGPIRKIILAEFE